MAAVSLKLAEILLDTSSNLFASGFHLSSEALKHLHLSAKVVNLPTSLSFPFSFLNAVIFRVINLLQVYKLTGKFHLSVLCNVII